MTKPPTCPNCHLKADRVIYAGFPMWLCPNEDCNTVWGFFSPITAIAFNGYFMSYEGPYLPALWTWLKGDHFDT